MVDSFQPVRDVFDVAAKQHTILEEKALCSAFSLAELNLDNNEIVFDYCHKHINQLPTIFDALLASIRDNTRYDPKKFEILLNYFKEHHFFPSVKALDKKLAEVTKVESVRYIVNFAHANKTELSLSFNTAAISNALLVLTREIDFHEKDIEKLLSLSAKGLGDAYGVALLAANSNNKMDTALILLHRCELQGVQLDKSHLGAVVTSNNQPPAKLLKAVFSYSLKEKLILDLQHIDKVLGSTFLQADVIKVIVEYIYAAFPQPAQDIVGTKKLGLKNLASTLVALLSQQEAEYGVCANKLLEKFSEYQNTLVQFATKEATTKNKVTVIEKLKKL